MKKRRLFWLLVVALLALALAACNDNAKTEGTTETSALMTTSSAVSTTNPPMTESPLEGDDPMAAYEYVSNKMKALGGYDVNVVEDECFGNDSCVTEMSVKINHLDGKKGMIRIRGAETLDITYIDGVAYCFLQSTGYDVKYKTTDAAVVRVFTDFFKDFDKENGKALSAAFTKRDSDRYLFQVKLDPSQAKEMLIRRYNYLDLNVSAYSDIAYSLAFECNAEGWVTEATEKLYFTINGFRCSLITEYTYQNVGTLPEITLPADADTYLNEEEYE